MSAFYKALIAQNVVGPTNNLYNDFFGIGGKYQQQLEDQLQNAYGSISKWVNTLNQRGQDVTDEMFFNEILPIFHAAIEDSGLEQVAQQAGRDAIDGLGKQWFESNFGPISKGQSVVDPHEDPTGQDLDAAHNPYAGSPPQRPEF